MTFIQSTILLKVFLKELGAIRKSYLIINSVRRMKSATCLHLKSPLRKRDVDRAKSCLRICSCLACVYRVLDARGKFGEHENCVRVARDTAESNFSFLSV